MAYLAIIQAFHPYMRLDSFYKGLMLLARHDCIIVKHFKLDYIKNWEMAKQFANEAFKKKKYHDALAYYDIAIGMLWETKSDRYRDRATLYSNASQAFFELNLIQNALLYANTSLSLDRTSIKSLYRKFSALLELGEFSQINSLLPIMY
jgi:tetratricopeptide (TPR) repeat protein